MFWLKRRQYACGDEYVIVEDVIKLTKILALTLMQWCGYEKIKE